MILWSVHVQHATYMLMLQMSDNCYTLCSYILYDLCGTVFLRLINLLIFTDHMADKCSVGANTPTKEEGQTTLSSKKEQKS